MPGERSHERSVGHAIDLGRGADILASPLRTRESHAVNAPSVVETLAEEFSVSVEQVQKSLELLSAGLRPPYLARVRRAECGGLPEAGLRALERRAKELDELDKRRVQLLASHEAALTAEGALTEGFRHAVASVTDRCELEDLFLPHRRAEPEVQLALDRGLGLLADQLVARAARVESPSGTPAEASDPTAEAESADDASLVEGDATEDHALEVPEPVADAAAHPSEHGHSGEGAIDSVHLGARIEHTPALARIVVPFVNPDRGVTTDVEALEGAVRILSDRLGRNPRLRGELRRLMRKKGRVHVHALVEEGKLGAAKALLKLDAPFASLSGQRLLVLRLALAQRLVAVSIKLRPEDALRRVRAALGRNLEPSCESVADVAAERALLHRLLPMLEEDLRGDLRDRAEEEAARLLTLVLRQTLLAPPGGHRPVAGVDVNAKGDWTILVVDAAGTPGSGEIRIETAEKGVDSLGQEITAALATSGVHALALGHGKGSRDAVAKLREIIAHLGVNVEIALVNEAGIVPWANSESARVELGELSVLARTAVSLARRYQDPLAELLKVEVQRLGIGREQAVISKSHLRRLLHDAVESCVASVGCELNHAPISLLRHVPGLDFDHAKKIAARRAERPFAAREELLAEGLLDETRYRNAAAFLRVVGGREPLDATALSPEQYELARAVLAQNGTSFEALAGNRDDAKRLQSGDLSVDEGTWRDLVRELGSPGRDPRLRHFPARLLPPHTDPASLVKDQIVEGTVTNVSGFGAFVDLGLAREGIVHVREISERFVRDARTFLSVGETVRARVLDTSGPRIELSLKAVPKFERPRPQRRERVESDGAMPAEAQGATRRERPSRGGGRGGRQEEVATFSDRQPVKRAARSRRDGLVTGGAKKKFGGGAGHGGFSGGSGGGGGKPGAGAPRRGGDRRDEAYDADAVRRASKAAGTYNPFASFFKSKDPAEPKESE